MLSAIGETFEIPFTANDQTDAAPSSLPTTLPDEITGVIVSARKAFYRINIWTRTASNENKARIENIGRNFKYGVLGFEDVMKIADKDKVSTEVEFMSHKDSQAKVRPDILSRSGIRSSFYFTDSFVRSLLHHHHPQFGSKVNKWTV